MRNPRNPMFALIAACLAMVCVGALSRQADGRPSPLGTAFTYQGQLKQDGSLYSGIAEFQFRLYDAVTGGGQVGPQIALLRGGAPTVSNGLFTVSLDFGSPAPPAPAIFNGEVRWLEMDVRTGLGAFTTLSPRQAISATPYALATRGMSVDSTGNVGIGTTSPESALHVAPGSAGAITGYGFAPLIVENSTHSYINMLAPYDGEEGILFGNPTGGPTEGGVIYNNFQTPRGLQFRTGGNVNRMVINQFGRVGIGTTNPGLTLHVVSGDQASIYGENTFSGGTGVLGWAGGSTGIGVYGYANSATGLNRGVMGQCNNPAGYDFYANGAGINYGAPSSIRWKSNVQAIADPLGMLNSMRGVYFDWDADHGGHHDIGFIGEEVGKVLPEVVAYEEDCEFVTGMDYGKLTPLLVEAVKALRAEKDAQIAALQQDNQRLLDRLAVLEAAVSRMATARQ